MRAEEQLQYMADFYPQLFPTRKHALNHLFCVLGNGFDWVNGELVYVDGIYEKRYKLREPIKKAEFINEENWYRKNKFYSNLCDKLPWEYDFGWYPLSKEFANLYNHPDDIKSDWKELLDECKVLLKSDGIEV